MAGLQEGISEELEVLRAAGLTSPYGPGDLTDGQMDKSWAKSYPEDLELKEELGLLRLMAKEKPD